jgi:fibronectin-binding autotransporter adhesin
MFQSGLRFCLRSGLEICRGFDHSLSTARSETLWNLANVSPTVDALNGDTSTTGGLITSSGNANQILTVGNNNEASATFAGTFTNATNALTFTKVGTGTQNLTGLNTYQGVTTISNGILGVNTLTREPGAMAFTTYAPFVTSAGAPSGANGSQTITLNATDMTNLLAAGAGVGSGVSGTNVGAGAIITNIDTANNTITLSVANAGAVGTALTLHVNRVTVAAATAAQLTVGMVVTGTGIPFGTTMSAINPGTNSVTLSQPGTATISGNLTYSTPSSIGISSNANTNLLIGSATSAGTLNYIGAAVTTDRGFSIVGTGAGVGGATINANGSGAIAFENSTRTITNTNNNTLTLGGANTGANTLNEILAGTGAGGSSGGMTGVSLLKTDIGTWVISAANTYTGSTNMLNGTLESGANGVLPNGSAINVNATGAGVTALLDMNGKTDSILSLSLAGTTTTSTADVSIGTGTLILLGNVTYNAANSPLGSTISGTGAGSLLGPTNRTFTVGNSSSAAKDLTVSAVISGGAGVKFIKAGPGVMEVSATNTYSGDTDVNDGALIVSGSISGTTATVAATLGTLNVTGTANGLSW